MKEDIIVQIAKRTVTEIKEQVLATPFIAQCWAIMGVLLVSWTGIFICVILQIAFVAYDQYKEVLSEIEEGESTEEEKEVNTSDLNEEKKDQ